MTASGELAHRLSAERRTPSGLCGRPPTRRRSIAPSPEVPGTSLQRTAWHVGVGASPRTSWEPSPALRSRRTPSGRSHAGSRHPEDARRRAPSLRGPRARPARAEGDVTQIPRGGRPGHSRPVLPRPSKIIRSDGSLGAPAVAQRAGTQPASTGTQVPSRASLRGLRVWCGLELRRRSQTRLAPGVAVAVVQAGGSSSDWTPSLGTSTSCRCCPKKPKKRGGGTSAYGSDLWLMITMTSQLGP